MKIYLKYIPLFLIFLFSTYFVVKNIQIRNSVIKTPYIQPTTNQTNKFPISLKIDDLSLNLPIESTETVNEKWQLNDKGLSFLKESPLPGNVGNSIIYGHNWPNLLANLKTIKENTVMDILFSDGTNKKFVLKSKFIVTPNETHILNQTNDSRVTLYTCTGFLDSKRFVAVFIPL